MGNAPRVECCSRVLALDEFHDQELLIAGFFEPMNDRDIWMIALFTMPPLSDYDNTRDGQRFLVNNVVKEPAPITVVLNCDCPQDCVAAAAASRPFPLSSFSRDNACKIVSRGAELPGAFGSDHIEAGFSFVKVDHHEFL